MKICLTIPSFAVHGGIRVILEWANRLTKWHKVFLFTEKETACNWFQISREVLIINDIQQLHTIDCLIICSPHHIHLRNIPGISKKFIFMQMAEHLFRPGNEMWTKKCYRFYKAAYPLFSISKWNIKLIEDAGRTGPIHYIGNGINLDHFPISHKRKDGKIVLVEGWESHNPSKDPDHIGPRVAAKLKKEGYYIIAFSSLPLKTYASVPDEFYQLPDLHMMNKLYERATIMVKVTKYDARSCAPMEAMTKGTVTVRGIIEGDDDLEFAYNCSRTDYEESKVFGAAMALLLDSKRRIEIAKNCIDYAINNSWDCWMPKINNIICSD